MLPPFGPASRRRTLLALLTLVANLIAAGVPVLHAAAHREHHHDEAHHSEAILAAADHADHDHGEVHPEALHDAAPSGRASPGFAFAVPSEAPVLAVVTGHERRDIPIPVPRLSSRAPPPGDRARAPPLA